MCTANYYTNGASLDVLIAKKAFLRLGTNLTPGARKVKVTQSHDLNSNSVNIHLVTTQQRY